MRWTCQLDGSDIPILADDEGGSTIAILGHGAGSHMEQSTMEALAGVVRSAGARVVRFNFLYRVRGRSIPDRMPLLMSTYEAVIESVRATLDPQTLIIGGHSMGGRTASMIAAESSVFDGLLLLGYPLHPAGQSEKLRDAHLPRIQTPTLCLNGTNDALCTKALMEAVLSRLDPEIWTMHWLEGADHSYSAAKASGRTKKEVFAEIHETITPWIGEISSHHRESVSIG